MGEEFLKQKLTESKDADFLLLLCQPIRRKTGEMWPFTTVSQGIIWAVNATAENVREEHFKDFVL